MGQIFQIGFPAAHQLNLDGQGPGDANHKDEVAEEGLPEEAVGAIVADVAAIVGITHYH